MAAEEDGDVGSGLEDDNDFLQARAAYFDHPTQKSVFVQRSQVDVKERKSQSCTYRLRHTPHIYAQDSRTHTVVDYKKLKQLWMVMRHHFTSLVPPGP